MIKLNFEVNMTESQRCSYKHVGLHISIVTARKIVLENMSEGGFWVEIILPTSESLLVFFLSAK